MTRSERIPIRADAPTSQRHAPRLYADLGYISDLYRSIFDPSNRDVPTAAARAAGCIPILVAEVDRLANLVTTARLHHANLTAAARATLAAYRAGEPDPLAYLEDELTGQWPEHRGER